MASHTAKRITAAAVWCAIGAIIVVACSNGSSSAPLPDDIRVVKPTGVATQRAAFSGSWHGAWAGKQDFYLIVERVNEKGASVVYAWGKGPDYRAGFRRARAKFEGDALVLHSPLGILPASEGATAAFRVRSDDDLDGTYAFKGRTLRAVLTRT